MDNFAQVTAATDISRFTGMRAAAKQDPDAAFSTVAKEFEALFIQMMLKAAREASPEGGLFDSRELKFYREMMDSQVALSMADQGGLGFEKILRAQLSTGPADASERALQLPQRRPFASEQSAPLWNASIASKALSAVHGNSANTKTAFVQQLMPAAERAATKLGVDAKTLIAQAALETGWGKHTISRADGSDSHNLFGIKANHGWTGDVVRVQTTEFVDGRPISIKAKFRAYRDDAAAFDDYVQFLQANQRYSNALENSADPRKFTAALAQAGYATDPRYAQKILSIRDQIAAQSMHAAH